MVLLYREMRAEFKEIFVGLKAAHEGQAKVAAETMSKYLNNIIKNPTEPKFRKIRLSNAVFQTNVGSLTNGIAYLQKAGFANVGEFLEVAEPDMTRVQAAHTELQVQLLYC